MNYLIYIVQKAINYPTRKKRISQNTDESLIVIFKNLRNLPVHWLPLFIAFVSAWQPQALLESCKQWPREPEKVMH